MMVDHTRLSNKKTLKIGDTYAVTTGKYLGEFFVYMDSCQKYKKFLSLPKMINREIETKHIDHALNKSILEFQETLPGEVKEICIKQYRHNEKNIHRRK